MDHKGSTPLHSARTLSTCLLWAALAMACTPGATPSHQAKTTWTKNVPLTDGWVISFQMDVHLSTQTQCPGNPLVWSNSVITAVQDSSEPTGYRRGPGFTVHRAVHSAVHGEGFAVRLHPEGAALRVPECDAFDTHPGRLDNLLTQATQRTLHHLAELEGWNLGENFSSTQVQLSPTVEKGIKAFGTQLRQRPVGIVNHQVRRLLTSEESATTPTAYVAYEYPTQNTLRCAATLVDSGLDRYPTVAITASHCVGDGSRPQWLGQGNMDPNDIDTGHMVPVHLAVRHNRGPAPMENVGLGFEASPINNMAILFSREDLPGPRATIRWEQQFPPASFEKLHFTGFGHPRNGQASTWKPTDPFVISLPQQPKPSPSEPWSQPSHVSDRVWVARTDASTNWGDDGAGLLNHQGHLLAVLSGTISGPDKLSMSPISQHTGFLQCGLRVANTHLSYAIGYQVDAETCPDWNQNHLPPHLRDGSPWEPGTLGTLLGETQTIVSDWETVQCNDPDLGSIGILRRTVTAQIEEDQAPVTLHMDAQFRYDISDKDIVHNRSVFGGAHPVASLATFFTAYVPNPQRTISRCPSTRGRCTCVGNPKPDCKCRQLSLADASTDAVHLMWWTIHGEPFTGEVSQTELWQLLQRL